MLPQRESNSQPALLTLLLTINMATMQQRNVAVPSSYLILKKDGEVLLGRRINTGYYDGYYALPAGHVEADELPLRGLIREAAEEIGVIITPENAKLVHTMYRARHDETGERVDFFFVVEQWRGDVVNTEPHKCDDLRWFSFDHLPKRMMSHVKYALEQYQEGIYYSEIPFNEQFVNPTAAKA